MLTWSKNRIFFSRAKLFTNKSTSKHSVSYWFPFNGELIMIASRLRTLGHPLLSLSVLKIWGSPIEELIRDEELTVVDSNKMSSFFGEVIFMNSTFKWFYDVTFHHMSHLIKNRTALAFCGCSRNGPQITREPLYLLFWANWSLIWDQICQKNNLRISQGTASFGIKATTVIWQNRKYLDCE